MQKVSKPGFESTNAPLIKNEVKLLGKNLRRVISGAILKYYYDESHKTLYCDYCRYSNLKWYLKDTERFVSLGTKMWILYFASESLAVLYDNGIFHGDIKTSNFLVAMGMWPKLSDFETSRSVDEGKRVLKKDIAGKTIPYAAPELFDDQTFFVDRRFDTYSFGMTMLEVLFPEVFYNIYSKMETALRKNNKPDPYCYV